MDRRKRIIIILALLLIGSVRSVVHIVVSTTIRTVDLLIIFATGAITGLLIYQIFSITKKKD
jgi:hypothetical protein